MTGHLNVKDVSLSRGSHALFENLSFSVSSGEVLWIQGTNGIGKTTLLRMMAGFIPPETGSVSWSHNGAACKASDIVSYQGHKDAFKSALTAQEGLSFWAKMYGYDGDLAPIFETANLANKLKVPTGNLSAGQKRRLSLARLIISQKPIWVMDEPTAAMDEAGTRLTEQIITEHAAHGGSVLIASHSPAKSFGVSSRRLTLTAAL